MNCAHDDQLDRQRKAGGGRAYHGVCIAVERPLLHRAQASLELVRIGCVVADKDGEGRTGD